ncbi:hypothetical protein BRADI_1g18900v3 [Brachypodium distachyon]|uniref:Pseudouridine synthase RsuA/RluA-like domain-containing protein n=1 Tax=Brachypodium distachyon TaxID=15368 RepID=A0A0Q3NCV3_BRADI|nr:hypothetical protein BRADI_1g18900v3 [Brachypodium distachyon]PNT74617.1 hypothetical protein BRADI_1g18900v3 [Brachypodium distachyon]
MPKPAATLASLLLPQLRHRPFPPPPPLLPRALSFSSTSSPLVAARRRFRFSPTTHLAVTAAAVSNVAVEAPAPTAYPAYDRILPCPAQDDPPRIEHLVAREDEAAGDFISRSLGLPPLYVADLIKFGAVYYALVAPQPPPYAAPEHVRIFREVTEPSVLRRRASIKGKTVREAQKTFRVTDPGQHLEAGTYLRVHVHPKRFPRCYQIDWKSRVIAVTDNYVVLNKPAATSVGGATDNIEESCVVFTSRALGVDSPLMTTHQIDNCSEGCVVLSKTKEFCSVFHGLIRIILEDGIFVKWRY